MISKLCQENAETVRPFTIKEVKLAISKLNNKKAPEAYGLAAEHLKHSSETFIGDITMIFIQLLESKTVPEAFKSGILTPVLKKAKYPSILDNYRGITVTPIMRKLFKSVLLPRLTESLDQSSLQFGFTKGLYPIMSKLIVLEAQAEVKMNTFEPLFLVALDSLKPFDVVNHIIMLD